MAKMPSSSSSRRRGTEEGEGASAPVNPGGQGLDGGPGQGEKREGGEAIRSPASPCAWGGGVVRGGGCGARGVLRGPLNRRPRRWSGEQALGGVNGGAVLGSPALYVHRRRRARLGRM